ncbi:MAG: hypothetical protein V4591_01925 [Bdellovibrionota bacterium]
MGFRIKTKVRGFVERKKFANADDVQDKIDIANENLNAAQSRTTDVDCVTKMVELQDLILAAQKVSVKWN